MSISRIFATVVALQLLCGLGWNTVFAQQTQPGTRPPFGGQSQPAGQPGTGGGINGGGAPSSSFPPAAGGMPSAARPSSGDTSVVVIDVSEVFKQHGRFKAQMDDMKEDVKKLETEAAEMQKRFQKDQERLRDLAPGSPDFKKLEEEMAHRGSEFTVTMQIKQREFGEKEAKIYYNTYTEVQECVKEFATRNGIRLVLRFNRGEMDPTKRETVLQGVNRPIVYQYKLDITDEIVRICNASMAKNVPPASKPALPRGNTLPR